MTLITIFRLCTKTSLLGEAGQREASPSLEVKSPELCLELLPAEVRQVDL